MGKKNKTICKRCNSTDVIECWEHEFCLDCGGALKEFQRQQNEIEENVTMNFMLETNNKKKV